MPQFDLSPVELERYRVTTAEPEDLDAWWAASTRGRWRDRPNSCPREVREWHIEGLQVPQCAIHGQWR